MNSSTSPYLRMNVIKTLLQLQPFFNSLAVSSSSNKAVPSYNTENDLFKENDMIKDNCSIQDMIKLLENVMETDFIEPQLLN